MILHFDDFDGGKRVAKYFEALYGTFPIFDIIVLKDKFSMLLFFFLICGLLVFHKINQVLMISDIFVYNLLQSNTHYFYTPKQVL